MKFAFDKTARRIDADGRLHVERSHISKATVNPYYGKEIPGCESLGLEPDRVYRLLRDPVELERGADSFARLPILSKHIPITVANVAEDPELKQLIVGAIGSQVEFKAPYLDADLCVWDATAIAGIDTDTVRELSCSYRYVPVMEPGEFEGQAYDGRMTEIRGNHLALVEAGRAGSDVLVSDRNPFIFNFKESAMKMTKLGAALFASLRAASTVLAADTALSALVGNADRKTLNKAELSKSLIAMDATLNPQQLDNVIDALLDVEQEPKAVELPQAAADESPADKVRALLAGKVDDALISQVCELIATPAEDEEPVMKKADVDAAMDSMRKEFAEADAARRDVRPVVGDVIAQDSAEGIYGFALDHLKVDRTGVEGVPALRALFKVAANAPKSVTPVVSLAADSAGLVAQFPGIARFKQA